MNTIEPSMCHGDAAFLSNHFDHLLKFCDPFLFLELLKLCTSNVVALWQLLACGRRIGHDHSHVISLKCCDPLYF